MMRLPSCWSYSAEQALSFTEYFSLFVFPSPPAHSPSYHYLHTVTNTHTQENTSSQRATRWMTAHSLPLPAKSGLKGTTIYQRCMCVHASVGESVYSQCCASYLKSVIFITIVHKLLKSKSKQLLIHLLTLLSNTVLKVLLNNKAFITTSHLLILTCRNKNKTLWFNI